MSRPTPTRARQLAATRAELERDIARREVAEEYAASLVEVRLYVYPAKRRRSEMHKRAEVAP